MKERNLFGELLLNVLLSLDYIIVNTKYKTLQGNWLKAEQHAPNQNPGRLRCSIRISRSCFACNTRRLYHEKNEIVDFIVKEKRIRLNLQFKLIRDHLWQGNSKTLDQTSHDFIHKTSERMTSTLTA